jgi:chaperonin GroES
MVLPLFRFLPEIAACRSVAGEPQWRAWQWGLMESSSRFTLWAVCMKIVPLDDKIVARRLEALEKSAGGILLPDSSREKPQQGRVLAVGAGVLLHDGTRAQPQVVEGDRIVFGKYVGTEVDVDGEELLILREGDVLAVLE